MIKNVQKIAHYFVVRPTLYGIVAVLFFISGIAYAVDDTFTVTATITSDTTAPSIPADLSATPVSTSQIDLSWTASTDNVAVTGYQVFRDSVQVATSSGTTYSDTGLSASTLYTYFVRAFDAALNISTSSDSVATTTLTAVVEEEEEGGGGTTGGSPALRITSIEVIPGTTTAIIKWWTAGHTRSVLKWGKSTSYEMGSVAESTFSLEHSTIITGLTPNTRYYFSINGENGVGAQRVMIESAFNTLALPDTNPPANVQDFRAEKENDDIRLRWTNPSDEDFDRVRILRSDRFFPSDLSDGVLIYEGDGEVTLDRGSAIPGTTQYFTLFTYDENGNISSGAVTSLSIDENGNVVVIRPDDIPVSPDGISLGLGDLIFMQNGERLIPKDGAVDIDGTQQLDILLDATALPQRLKSIIVTVYDGDFSDKSFSFLLRINEEGTFYTASLAPFGESGKFPLSISVFDYATEKVAQVEGSLIASVAAADTEGSVRDYLLQFIVILLILLLIAARFIFGAKEENQHKKKT